MASFEVKIIARASSEFTWKSYFEGKHAGEAIDKSIKEVEERFQITPPTITGVRAESVSAF